jgi:hypothetical protein
VRRFIVAAVLLALAGCGEEGAGERTDWVAYRDEELGLAVRYPSDWHRAEERLTPNLGDPVEILSLGTHPLESGSPRCNQFPVRAVEAMGPADVFVSVQERRRPVPGELSPRPQPFKLPTAPGNMFCVPDPRRNDAWLSFGDGGRGFYMIIAVAQKASPETRRDLVEVLNSLQFEPRD